MSDIFKQMGQRAFGGAPVKRPAASATDASPAAKKPAEPTNGLFQGQQNAAPKTPQQPTEKPPPPFYVRVTTEWPALAQRLKDLVGGDIQATARGPHFRVQTSTVENFRKIQRDLLGNKVPFHTFTLGGGRNLKVVISGLPHYIGEEDLHTALTEKRFDVQDACRLRSRQGRSGRWLVTFTRDDEREDDAVRPAAHIWRVRELLHVRISVGSYRKPPGPPQCYHCQRYGHGSSNCGHPSRCVRCGGPHNATKCQQPAGFRKCCNCGGDHQANWRGCKTFADARTAAEPRPVRRPTPRHHRQPPEKTRDSDDDEAAPAEEVEQSSTEEEAGFSEVRKRRKRQPRNRTNRKKRANTDPAAAKEKRPAPQPAAKATASAVSPKPKARATREPATTAVPSPTEQPATAAPAPAIVERAEIFAALTELCRQITVLTGLISQLVNQRGQ